MIVSKLHTLLTSWTYSPHLCVGFLFLILYPAASSSASASSAAPLSHSHNFVTHHLSHTIFHTPSHSHNFVTHTTWQAWHCGTRRHLPAFGVAGVALVALGWLWWRAWSPLVARGAAPLCVAGVALGDNHLRFTWQAWYLRHVAGSGGALGRRWSPEAPRHFSWQAWHLVTSTFVSRGRRGTWRHLPAFCVAHVALVALGWLWWRAWSPLVARGAAPLCVAGVISIVSLFNGCFCQDFRIEILSPKHSPIHSPIHSPDSSPD